MIILLYILLFILLTAITQVGGLALLAGLWMARFFMFRFRVATFTIVAYILLTYLIVPFLAPAFGREKVRNSKVIKPTNYMTMLLNRNYVRPQLNGLLQRASVKLPQGVDLRYLDASFPFIDGFPMLPHLSHNDGKKIDISFVYTDSDGILTNAKPSRSGYGIFEGPASGEFDQTQQCKGMGYWQFDLARYLTLGETGKGLKFSVKYTRQLLFSLLSERDLGKVFLERHLKERMNLHDTRLRFQGCGSVRHDDHIHIQLR